MGKQPATGQKKSKAAIAKAAQSKKGGKKKWSKGKTRDKVDNASFLLPAAHDRILADPSKAGRLISISTVSDKFKVKGSIAKRVIRTMHEKKLVKKIAQNGQQFIYTSAVEKKVAEPAAATKATKGRKK